jgi:hypothetical protein
VDVNRADYLAVPKNVEIVVATENRFDTFTAPFLQNRKTVVLQRIF